MENIFFKSNIESGYLHSRSQVLSLPQEALDSATEQYWNANDHIIYNNEASGLFWIKSGLIQISRILTSGERKIVFLLSGGNFFFEEYLFNKHEIGIEAIVLNPAYTLFWGKKLAINMIHNVKLFVEGLLSNIIWKESATATNLAISSYYNTEKHILYILHCYAEANGERVNSSEMEIKISQMDLADLVGIHRVSISRALKKMEDSGLLRTGRNRIFLNIGTKSAD